MVNDTGGTITAKLPQMGCLITKNMGTHSLDPYSFAKKTFLRVKLSFEQKSSSTQYVLPFSEGEMRAVLCACVLYNMEAFSDWSLLREAIFGGGKSWVQHDIRRRKREGVCRTGHKPGRLGT